MPESQEYYPGKQYQRLFNEINDVSPNPIISQMDDIIHIVRQDFLNLNQLYEDWIKETKRNGSVLVGSSIREFFKWVENK